MVVSLPDTSGRKNCAKDQLVQRRQINSINSAAELSSQKCEDAAGDLSRMIRAAFRRPDCACGKVVFQHFSKRFPASILHQSKSTP
jgi:hypothetical protein